MYVNFKNIAVFGPLACLLNLDLALLFFNNCQIQKVDMDACLSTSYFYRHVM